MTIQELIMILSELDLNLPIYVSGVEAEKDMFQVITDEEGTFLSIDEGE